MVDGNPYSLAIQTNIEPKVGCRGNNLPRLHFLFWRCISSGFGNPDECGGRIHSGGMTDSKNGVDLIGGCEDNRRGDNLPLEDDDEGNAGDIADVDAGLEGLLEVGNEDDDDNGGSEWYCEA